MTDVHSEAQRSFNMSRIGSRDTKPELIVRSIGSSPFLIGVSENG
jgi:DNA mismatch endonuclease, patch repair protein